MLGLSPQAVAGIFGVHFVTYYIEVAVHNWRWSLEECFVHVCKELEGIAASAEALDGEHHVPDAFFLPSL